MTTLNPRLRLALLNRKKPKNILEQGFTLVELMIVIVIVGILSAVALPNFLNQTNKAKATEAQTQISAAFKNAQVLYIEEGIDGVVANSTECTNFALVEEQDQWTYACSTSGDVLTITAENNDDETFLVTGSVDLVSGSITKPSISQG